MPSKHCTPGFNCWLLWIILEKTNWASTAFDNYNLLDLLIFYSILSAIQCHKSELSYWGNYQTFVKLIIYLLPWPSISWKLKCLCLSAISRTPVHLHLRYLCDPYRHILNCLSCRFCLPHLAHSTLRLCVLTLKSLSTLSFHLLDSELQIYAYAYLSFHWKKTGLECLSWRSVELDQTLDNKHLGKCTCNNSLSRQEWILLISDL